MLLSLSSFPTNIQLILHNWKDPYSTKYKQYVFLTWITPAGDKPAELMLKESTED